MNRARKNIVIVGFTKDERLSIGLPYIENNKVHYLESLKDVYKYQGYLLIYDNKTNINLVDIDKKYRKVFNKYARVFIYNESYEYKHDKWSNIEKVNRSIFGDISYSITEEWESYKNATLSTNRQSNIDKKNKLEFLYEYLKKYKIIKTNKIMKDLNMTSRTIERYMNVLNSINHNIGYDYKENEWYIIW